MTVALPLALAFLMWVVGLQLRASHLWQVFRQPKALIVGLVVQVGLLPMMAFGIGHLLALPPVLFLGLLIIAISPGGITSNYVTLLAGADVALSTAMTLVTSLVAGFTIPLLLTSGLSLVEVSEISGIASLVRMVLAMTAVTAVPLLFGMAVRRFAPTAAGRLEGSVGFISKLVFAAVVLTTFWQNRAVLVAHFASIGPACVLLNVGAIAAGLATRWAARLSDHQSLAISIEAGLQNAAVAIFVATVMLLQTELAAPALVYAVVMNVSSIGIIFFVRKSHAFS
jgi:BASS family bile acid:Na+ symporter